MAHVSLYRKYRSQTFGDLVGQPHVVKTLQSAIASGKFAHAYLFIGPRGTGKTSTARLLAKALCCEKGPAPEPCNECEICRSITAGNCMDVIEMDAASDSGVGDVRDAIVRVADYRPSLSRFKVFIIDEVHDLSAKAFDALLKTIEEPPEHLVFILATTEYSKVPPTIRSRCQQYEFHRATLRDLVSRLEHVAKGEGIEIEPAALGAIARLADGGYRDALNLLEQAALVSDGAITLEHAYNQLGLIVEQTVDELLFAMRAQDFKLIAEILGGLGQRGKDPRAILESMMYRLTDLTHAAFERGDDPGSDVAQSAALRETASRLGADFLLALRSAVARTHQQIRDVTLPRIWLEAELIRIASEVSPQALKAEPAQAVRSAAVATKTTERVELASTPPADQQLPAAQVPNEAPPAEDEQPPAAQVPDEAPPAEVVREDAPTLENGDGRAREVWAKVVATIQQGKPSSVSQKLAGTRAVELKNGTLRIEFDRQIDRDGILEGKNGPARSALLERLVREFSGEPWTVEYTVAKRSKNGSEPTAVELPLEGQRLVEAAREVFPGS